AAEASDAASARNQATLAAALPALAEVVDQTPAEARGRRVAVRATTPDRLPLCGAWGETGLYVLTGLGSRGFCVAPLLGEHLAALIMGRSSPV
ncbi:FAD-dependent oxidoreductase, partial [Acinetobacter baumannii]